MATHGVLAKARPRWVNVSMTAPVWAKVTGIGGLAAEQQVGFAAVGTAEQHWTGAGVGIRFARC